MQGRLIHAGTRAVASFLAAILLVFAALPALHGAHGVANGSATPALAEADATWTAADADCPLCRGLVRARVAPPPPHGTLHTHGGSLPLADRHDRVAPCDAPGSERARAPPTLA